MRYKIFNNGEHINTIIADEDFITIYCEKNGYTFEAEILPEPEPQPEPEPTPTTGDVSMDELAKAIKEGVNSI